MKRLVFLLLFSTIALVSFSQTFISTEGIIYSTISTEQITYKDESYCSLFEFNEAGTMLKHRISNMSSTYYIKEKKIKDGQLLLDVVSDVGNNYIMVVDKERNLYLTFNEKEDYVIVYRIKSIWK